MAAGPRSRHINIRYFLIKDRSSDANITIRHCRTLAMFAVLFTKPLQGHQFQKFKAVLLGRTHFDSLTESPMVPIKERVGGMGYDTHGALHTVSPGTGTARNGTELPWVEVVKRGVKMNPLKVARACGQDTIRSRLCVSKIGHSLKTIQFA